MHTPTRSEGLVPSPDPTWREQGDPVADGAMASLWAEGPGQLRRGDPLALVESAATHSEPCRAFVEAVTRTPSWSDPELLEEGRQVSLSLAVPIGVVLLLGGLPEVYAVPGIARVLAANGRMEYSTWRRMLETGRFVRDVHVQDGLRDGRDGRRAVARVRLIHALVRRRAGPVTGARQSAPINQAEMAFTLAAHSHLVRRGLASLGFALSPREARAHQHLWRHVGHLIGVDERLLAIDPAAEQALYDRLAPQLVDGGADSRRLVSRSIETLAAQAHVPAALVRTIVRRLVGGRVGDVLGVSAPGPWRLAVRTLVGVGRGVNALRRVTPAVTHRFAALGQRFADAVVKADPCPEPVGVAAARDCARAERSVGGRPS